MKRRLRAIVFFVALILIWEELVVTKVWSEFLIPSPGEVAQYYITAIADGSLLTATLVTLKRLLMGYAASILLGIPLGIIIARFQIFEDTLGLIALGLQTLPSICWAPLALLWFGQTEQAMFFIVVMGSVWSIVLATDSGVRHVPPIYIRAARTMGSKGLHTWVKVILPASLPFILTGMKQGLAFSWRSLMAAEIYITILTGFGLGHLLHYGRELHEMDAVIGVMFVIILIGMLIDKIFFSPLEKFLHHRWGTSDSVNA